MAGVACKPASDVRVEYGEAAISLLASPDQDLAVIWGFGESRGCACAWSILVLITGGLRLCHLAAQPVAPKGSPLRRSFDHTTKRNNRKRVTSFWTLMRLGRSI